MSDEIPAVTVGDVDELNHPFLLDVREPDEFDAGHAPDATPHPLGTLPEVSTLLPTDRPILCICRSGGRSAQATAFLRDQGFDAINLEGGMQAWAAFGLDVLRADGTHGAVI